MIGGRLYIIAFLIIGISSGCSNNQSRIGVQPFTGVDPSMIEVVEHSIIDVYGFEVVVLPEIEMPPSAFIDVKSPRYRADTLIAFLKRTKTDSFDHIVGLTHHDISTTKRDKDGNVKTPPFKYEDWGVFGLGFRPGESCVVSTFRLNDADQEKYRSRVSKVSVHEIGHNLGLGHCSSSDCVMQDAAERIATVDGVELNLCEACSAFVND